MARRRTGLAALAAAERKPVVEVAREVSDRLRLRGVPHALVGGLAVAEYGYARYTKDVDVLVPSDRADVLSTVSRGVTVRLAFKSTVPLRGVSFVRRSVEVDVLAPLAAASFLDEYLVVPKPGAVPVLAVEALVYMKLVSGRAQDDADVIALLKRWPTLQATARGFLEHHNAQRALVLRLDDLAARAAEEI